MESRKILLAFAIKYDNDWNRMYQAIQSKEELTEVDKDNANSFTGNYITLLDDNYPARLKNRYKPPFILYYEGDINLLKRVDDNDGKNDLVFLHGPNTLRIPNDNLCTITASNKVDICGGLRVWFNCHSDSVDRFGLAAGLCQNIVGTKVYPENSRSWFLGVTIPTALRMGADIYMVPTSGPSFNNRLIKEGCNLIDSASDIIYHNKVSSDMPF